ncbi:MAG TPA: YadA-like family protein [Scandinavium sp.]|uniref:YadA-like family protein n=1 Tax=Scandinavium sp. TaxID=2830653 RepID=UPI002E37D370|nr:YadA-like family protein [Scandinavium sp.]HEX4501482.1 YadA-like family protein [Scandinavium sp.]
MKMKLIALAIMASAASGMAHAQLSAADLAVVEAYHQAHPEVPQDKINEMEASSRNDLQSVEDYMKTNTYYDGHTNVPLPPLTPVPIVTVPVQQPVASTLSDEAAAHQQDPRQYRQDENTYIEITAEKQQRESAAAQKGADLIKSNQERTAEQKQALNAARLAKFQQLKNDAILKGESLVAANQERTAEQKDALQNSLQQRFAQLKGESLVAANQGRTAEQKDALHNSLQQRFAQLKGESLVAANQERTAEQKDALQNSLQLRYAQLKGDALVKANQQRTAEQKDALQDSLQQRYAQLKGDALAKANQERTAEQKDALQNSLQQRYAQLKGDALVTANRARSAEQIVALNDAEKEAASSAPAVNASAYRTNVNAQVAERSREDQITQSNETSNNVKKLASDIQQAQNTGAYAESRANAAFANTEANRQALVATNHRVADNSAAIAQNEHQIQSLQTSTNARFSDLNKQVDDNRERASAAISGVAAMANIPQVIQGQTFSVGAGAGTTDGESALAVGFSARATEHVVVKASVSDDTQQNFVVGGGVSYGW